MSPWFVAEGRPAIEREVAPLLRALFLRYPVVTVTGPRQSGKTTLARMTFPDLAYVNLEAPDERARAEANPRAFLGRLQGGAVLDEIQRAPALVSYIQAIVDEAARPGMFVLTGSQHFGVIDTIGQSLAGRTAILRLLPFSIAEAGSVTAELDVDAMLRLGFYPRIHALELDPTQTLGDYVETYVERDVRNLAGVRNLEGFRRFLGLCAGRVGQLLNLQSLGNDAGVSHTTAREWMSVLQAGFVAFTLPPYHGNLSKRLIKSPKLYFYDVGLAAFLLGIEERSHLFTHPLRGALFENLVVVEALKHRFNQGRRGNILFYRDSAGHEVDLLYEIAGKVAAVEVKAGETVPSGAAAPLDRLAAVLGDRIVERMIVYGGEAEYSEGDVRVMPAPRFAPALSDIDRRLGAAQ